jgi:hypothetical protein
VQLRLPGTLLYHPGPHAPHLCLDASHVGAGVGAAVGAGVGAGVGANVQWSSMQYAHSLAALRWPSRKLQHCGQSHEESSQLPLPVVALGA